MTEYIVTWTKAHRAIVDADNEDKAKQLALLTRDTAIGIVNGVVHVEEYDEILEAQLEWMRNARGD